MHTAPVERQPALVLAGRLDFQKPCIAMHIFIRDLPKLLCREKQLLIQPVEMFSQTNCIRRFKKNVLRLKTTPGTTETNHNKLHLEECCSEFKGPFCLPFKLFSRHSHMYLALSIQREEGCEYFAVQINAGSTGNGATFSSKTATLPSMTSHGMVECASLG